MPVSLPLFREFPGHHNVGTTCASAGSECTAVFELVQWVVKPETPPLAPRLQRISRSSLIPIRPGQGLPQYKTLWPAVLGEIGYLSGEAAPPIECI